MGALYLCTSTLLAAILLAAYLIYAWDIDQNKWYKALAVLQGIDLSAMEQAAQKEVDKMSYDDVLARRSARLLDEDFQRDVRQPASALPPPPEDPKPAPPPPEPSDAEKIGAYEKRLKSDRAKARSSGLDEQTRLIENMDPEQAKEVIRKYWKDGQNQRVLIMLLDMTDKRRENILYAMQQDNTDELKDLCEILQRIGDGEPAASFIENAAKEP
jgi:hypothetical protein